MPHIPTNNPGTFRPGSPSPGQQLFSPELSDAEFRREFVRYCASFTGTEEVFERIAPAEGDTTWKENRKFHCAIAAAFIGLYGQITDLDARVLQLEETAPVP